MTKKLKGIFWLTAIALILAAGVTCQPAYGAAGSDLKKDKGVKWLTENICFYITSLYAHGHIDEGDKGTMQMTYIDRFNIATELAGGKYGKYSSSYEKDGISLLENGNYSSYCPVNTAFANQLYRALFHKQMQVPDSRNTLVRAKFINGYTYVGFGEFGDSYPSYSIKGITKVKKGVYKVKAENRFHIIDPDDGKKYNRIGYTWVTLKKDKKAEYGYKVVKCSYRMFRQMQ